jgi:disulfide bond formation protein DsbB
LAAVVVSAGLVLGACGGDDGETSSGGGGGGEAAAGDAAAGQETFSSSCASCHGPGGEGLPDLGKDLTTSEFVSGQTDDELVAFIKVGRDSSDPANTTGVAMPPKGGNPALTDDQLADVVAYIRSIER